MSEALFLPMSEGEFAEIFARLAVQLRWHDAGETEARCYYDALRHFKASYVRTAATNLALEPGRKYFPTTGEWRDGILTAQREENTQLLTERAEWRTECTDCDDTGWNYHQCKGTAQCGRDRAHAAHEYVTECPCRPTNRTYQRHHQRKLA